MSGRVDLFEHGNIGIVALKEEIVRAAVGIGVHQDRRARAAVAAGAADLLVVAFHAAGQRGVDDGADVRLVDAHAEGDGRDDDVELAREEIGLHLFAARGRPGPRGTAAAAKSRCSSSASFSASAARGRVDDGGPALVVREEFGARVRARCPARPRTTSMAMLSRRKPWMNCFGASRPSCCAMSSCTSGVAVAVSAMTGAGRSSGRRWPSMR